MMRFVQAAAFIALVATLVGCSDHMAELERARDEKAAGATPAASATSNASLLPGLPTTPNAGTTPTLPGGSAPPGTSPPPAGAQLACPPRQVAMSVPVWRAPSQPRAACTQQEGAAIVTCAFSNQNCNVPSATCRGCAVSPKATSSFYGPLIVDEATGGLEINVEGCAALMQGDISANGCGPKLMARFQCEEQACSQCQNPQDAAACMQAADTGVCASAVANANACMSFAQQCLAGATEQDIAFNLIGLFCGG